MMQRHDLPHDERLQAMLADRATGDLSEAELAKLREQLGPADTDALDMTAASLQVHWQTMSDKKQELPPALRARLTNDARIHFSSMNDHIETEAPANFVMPSAQDEYGDAMESNRGLALMGWFAAAAAIVIAVIGWMPRQQDATPTAVTPTPAELRSSLLAGALDTVTVEWKGLAQPGFEKVSGDVVWSDRAQTGFMRLVGMPANNPSDAQYQLWIVDPDVDKHPVDGGVFDIDSATGELIIPIDAKLVVTQPAAFVITEERPGGVVVSDGPHLVIAAVDS